MQQRYHLCNNTHFVEFPHNPEGQRRAIAFRDEHPEFKGKHIASVLQAYPEKVPYAAIKELT